MKISDKNYNVLLESAQSLHERWPASLPLHKQKLASDPKVKDVEKRFRWDLLYALAPPSWVVKYLYDEDGLHDTHIDTALRNIVKELGL